ncbi:MAG: hypothetical protein D4R67_10625 [Bacteroidetes bacterium]|nr:MAG: hypothetical protein D4R67_10625 [Bacteroidota bacterium]
MDKITISNSRLLDFNQALEAVKNFKGAKFGYAISRSLRSIDPFVKSLLDASRYSAEFSEFLQAREELGLPFAVTSDGNPLYDIYKGELFLQIIPEHSASFIKKYESLKKKYAKAIQDNETQQREYQDLLKQEVSIDVFAIDIDLLPEDISFGQAFRLLPMIQSKVIDPLIPCSFPNNVILNFPSQFLRNFAGVTNRGFILGMLENFRILDRSFLELQKAKTARDYNDLYEDGRVALCEKFADRNEYGNPKMIPSYSGIEYSIPNSPDYSKSMKLFKASMKDVISEYDTLLKTRSTLHLSPISFDQLPVDFSGTQIDLLADLIRE